MGLLEVYTVWSSIGSVFDFKGEEKEENKVEEFLNSPHILHTASMFYRKMSNIQTRMCEILRLTWQKDLGNEIREESWQEVVSNIGWSTRGARSKFIHYKIVHRYYFTPLKLYKMDLTKNNKCWKCNKEAGTFLHGSVELSYGITILEGCTEKP